MSQSPSPSISCVRSSGLPRARPAQRLLGDVDRQHLRARALKALPRTGPRRSPRSSTRAPGGTRPAGSAAAARSARARGPEGSRARALRGRPATASRARLDGRIRSMHETFGASGKRGSAHSCREAVKAIYSCAQRLCWRCEAWGERGEHQTVRRGSMKVALDSRPAVDRDGVGRYARCILQALRETAAASDRGARHEPSLANAARPRHGRLPHPVDRRRDAAQPLPDGRHGPRSERPEAAQRASAHEPAPAPAPARPPARRVRDRAERGRRRRRGRPPAPRPVPRGGDRRGRRRRDVPARASARCAPRALATGCPRST